jgi:hypothetical protein
MARATTKTDLTTAANGQFEKLWKLIDSMTEEKQHATFAFGDDFLQLAKYYFGQTFLSKRCLGDP